MNGRVFIYLNNWVCGRVTVLSEDRTMTHLKSVKDLFSPFSLDSTQKTLIGHFNQTWRVSKDTHLRSLSALCKSKWDLSPFFPFNCLKQSITIWGIFWWIPLWLWKASWDKTKQSNISMTFLVNEQISHLYSQFLIKIQFLRSEKMC